MNRKWRRMKYEKLCKTYPCDDDHLLSRGCRHSAWKQEKKISHYIEFSHDWNVYIISANDRLNRILPSRKIPIRVVRDLEKNATKVAFASARRNYENRELVLIPREHRSVNLYTCTRVSVHPFQREASRHRAGDAWSITVTVVEAAQTCSQKWVRHFMSACR